VTVELADAHRVLSLLAEAIAGDAISLDPVDAGTAEASALSPPRRSVVLRETAEDRRRRARIPTRIDRFADDRDNMRAYRAVLLRQVGRVELGTFDVDPEARPDGSEAPIAREERLVDPSTDLALLWQLYGLLEDTRVGAELRRRYPGARRALDLLDGAELAELSPVVAAATLRVRTVDALTRRATGSVMAALQVPGATAAMSARLAWELVATILRAERAPTVVIATPGDELAIPGPEPEEASAPSSFASEAADDLELQTRLDALDGLDVPGLALEAELLAGLAAGEGPAAASVGGASAPELAVTPPSEDDEDSSGAAPKPRSRRAPSPSAETLARRVRTFLYDEWDVTGQRYRRGWCRLREIRLDGAVDGAAYAVEVRRRHAALAGQVRRRFASVTPNAFVRVHRTLEGDELSTDALLDAVIERRRGRIGDERVYVRRERARREVAAAFLLDMSRSTDQPVIDPDAPAPSPASEPSDPETYLSYWDAPAPSAARPARRVIDVARDSLVLMCDALETLGDLHAVYGFSGEGRSNVEFFVAKDFADPSGAASSARVAAMEPVRYTRMGPAVRHATRRLSRVACRTRVLLVVSDGYPQDEDYGPDRNDREYGIADTAKALEEAERLGITTFCITIDPSGHDYLRRMCPEHRYLVLDDIHQLPGELEKVYRSLTGRDAASARR
jgi:hypothetical protein